MQDELNSFHLFVYDSLKDPLVFRSVTGMECPRKSSAVLPGYGIGSEDDANPVIFPNEKASVIGELIHDIPEELLSKLDKYSEKSRTKLKRQEITVRANHQLFEAFTYVSANEA